MWKTAKLGDDCTCERFTYSKDEGGVLVLNQKCVRPKNSLARRHDRSK